jgi:2-dehydro-3-deoxygluconokinase
MYDVTTLGEIMLRLSVPPGQHLENATALEVHPAGSEANLVFALSRLGRRGAWFGGLPDNSLGRLAANQLRSAGINLDGVVWFKDGRMGLYFLELAVPPRPNQVIYDRSGSCAASLQPEQIDWSGLLDTRLLHLSGITPAISPIGQLLIQEAVRRARLANTPLSFDVNYRARLWSTAAARQVLTPLIEGAALLFCSQVDARRVFGLSGEPEAILAGLVELSQAEKVVLSIGASGAIAWASGEIHRQPAFPVTVIDRIGAGDALAAGVIYGWLDGNFTYGLRLGALLASLILSQKGDMLLVTQDEIAGLLNSNSQEVNR